jgi:hypothetical protein
MSEVRKWPIVGARIDPKLKEEFAKKIKINKETQSHALRRMIRLYNLT